LLLLSMIALGALKDASLKARRLSMGLLEIYRIALLHLVDKDISSKSHEIDRDSGPCAAFEILKARKNTKYLDFRSQERRNDPLRPAIHLPGSIQWGEVAHGLES
jgi:hypothetical protein